MFLLPNDPFVFGLSFLLLISFGIHITRTRERIVSKLEMLMKFCNGLEANIKQGNHQRPTAYSKPHSEKP